MSETKTSNDRPLWMVVEVHGENASGEYTDFLIADHDASASAIMLGEEAVYGQVADRNTADIIVKAVNTFPDLLAALKGVVRVADRATVEFDAARAAIAKAEGRPDV